MPRRLKWPWQRWTRTAMPASPPKKSRRGFGRGRRLAWGLEGTKQDPRAALKWFRLAAEQGHPRAQTQLGMAYQKGRGVGRDLPESVKWMRKAENILCCLKSLITEKMEVLLLLMMLFILNTFTIDSAENIAIGRPLVMFNQ